MNSQASLTDQLQVLVGLANRHGLYDAADFIAPMVRQGWCPRCEHDIDAGTWHRPDPEHFGYGACVVETRDFHGAPFGQQVER